MTCLILTVRKASTFFERAQGLLGYKEFPRTFGGVYFERCRAVHTLGMRFSIDVVFIDKRGVIVKIAREVSSQRAWIGCWKAQSVVELPSGRAAQLNVGDALKFEFV